MIAILVPVLGDGLDAQAFDGAWTFMLAAAGASALALAAMGPVKARVVPAVAAVPV